MAQRYLAQLRRQLSGLSKEDWSVVLFGASFFVGIWYALPMLTVITDSWSYAGGVLRSLQAHSLLPGAGVEYGTLTFYLNYAAIVVYLAIGFVVSGFHLSTLIYVLTLHPEYIYWAPRATSAAVGFCLLWMLYRFLKEEVSSLWYRWAILLVTFGTPLTLFLLRSGKMWTLSIALGTLSFMYTYLSVRDEAPAAPGPKAKWALLFAGLSAANFPLSALYFINVPIFLYAFTWSKANLFRLVRYGAYAGVIILATFALNAGNIIHQIADIFLNYHPIFSNQTISVHLGFIQSLILHGQQTVDTLLVPIVAVIAIAAIYGVRDRALVWLSAIYALLFFFVIAYLANWFNDPAYYLRYAFPLSFFSLFLLAALNPPRKGFAIILVLVGGALYAYTALLLSLPTTYNEAYTYIAAQYGNQRVVIQNYIFELDLPMNKTSYTFTSANSCATKCQSVRALPQDIGFMPTILNSQSDYSHTPTPALFITSSPMAACTPIKTFGTAPDDNYIDSEHNLGRLLLPYFYTFPILGKNIYLYNYHACSMLPPFSPDPA